MFFKRKLIPLFFLFVFSVVYPIQSRFSLSFFFLHAVTRNLNRCRRVYDQLGFFFSFFRSRFRFLKDFSWGDNVLSFVVPIVLDRFRYFYLQGISLGVRGGAGAAALGEGGLLDADQGPYLPSMPHTDMVTIFLRKYP